MLHEGIPTQCEMHNVIMCVAEAGGPHDTTCLERGAQQTRGYRMMYEFPFCEDRETVVAGLASEYQDENWASLFLLPRL